jgi:hypothetical protein
MTVRFCSTEVPVLPGYAFTIDGNSKITASGGTFDDPRPNALSLPHVSCCPGATSACIDECYVHGLSQREVELYAAYKMNERTLHAVLLSKSRIEQAAKALGTWIAEHCTAFRWHVSGDVINDRHAKFITTVCGWSRRTAHWIYTRTHDEAVLEWLTLAPNLALNLSVDRVNWSSHVEHLAIKYRARLCYMTSGEAVPRLPPGSVIFPTYALRRPDFGPFTHELPPDDGPLRRIESDWWEGLTHDEHKQVCPSDYFGHSPSYRCGPCRKCMVPA